MNPSRTSTTRFYGSKAVILFLTLLLATTTRQSLADDKKSETPAKETAGFYDPVERQIEGWTIDVDPRLLNEENRELG